MRSVLVVTNEQDLGADLVMLELERRQVFTLRCNTERLLEWRVAIEPGLRWELVDPLRRCLSSEDTVGVWWRRPDPPLTSTAFESPAEQTAFREQWQAVTEAMASVPGPRWMSPPAAIRAAEDKATQLACAMSLGFRVPRTIWTNDLDHVHSVASAGRVVAKPAATAAWEDERGAAFVFAQILGLQDLPDADHLATVPAAFQEPVVPKRDLRVTVIGQRAFGALAADAGSPSDVDWRLVPDRRWAPFELSTELVEKCLALVNGLGLRFGAIDLVLDEDEAPWFLEINPNGEWGWLNQRAGLPLAAAIADELSDQ
jgi:hypothetical protein